MKTNLIIIGVCLSAALLGTILIDHFVRPVPVPIHTQMADTYEPAPSVTFTDVKGKAHRLDDYTGRGVIINFWATWCAPCRIEMPQLFALAKTHAQDLTLILVSVDADAEAIEAFLRNNSLVPHTNIIIVHDPRKEISKDVFGTVRYPESILIDRHGLMREKIAGGVDWTRVDLSAILGQ